MVELLEKRRTRGATLFLKTFLCCDDTPKECPLERNPGTGAFPTLTYFIGATLAQALFFSVHEITHNLAFRPLLVKPVRINRWLVGNILFQAIGMVLILPFSGWEGTAYLLFSMVFAGGIHPIAGHFISEHYVFKEGQETYSYYGPLNRNTVNVGYPNEHYDFPGIPGSRLPELRRISHKYSDDLHSRDLDQ